MGIPWWAQILAAITAVGGAAVGVVRVLWSNDHRSHKTGCMCRTCQDKRRRADDVHRARRLRSAVDRRHDAERAAEQQLHRMKEPDASDINDNYLSTAQLDNGMIVEFRSSTYLVKNIRTSVGGYYVELQNMDTNTDFITIVAFSLGNVRMWQPREGFAQDMPGQPPRDSRVTEDIAPWDNLRPKMQPEAPIIQPDYEPDFRPCIMEDCILRSGHEGDCKRRQAGHSGV